jgi:hypothetical protein
MQTMLFISLGGVAFCAVSAYLTWSISIHRYVEVYRGNPALFFLPWAPLVDARKARKIAKWLNQRPTHLKLYRAFELSAVVFAVASIVLAILLQGEWRP